MPLYVLDTDTVTFQQAGREHVLRRLAVVPPDAVSTTVITVREQRRGRLAVMVLSVDGILVTSNRRDFDRVAGLRMEDWHQ